MIVTDYIVRYLLSIRAKFYVSFLFLFTPRPPTSRLFPYTTLFRSHPASNRSCRARGPGVPRYGPARASTAADRRRAVPLSVAGVGTGGQRRTCHRGTAL